MSGKPNEKMEKLAVELMQEYLASKENYFEDSRPVTIVGTRLETGYEVVVVVFRRKTAYEEKAAGLTPRAAVPRCPTCNRPF